MKAKNRLDGSVVYLPVHPTHFHFGLLVGVHKIHRMNSILDLFSHAVLAHQNGALRQAEALYRQVLQADPVHSDAHSNLGVILQVTGRPREALAAFARAVQCNPRHGDAQNNLGNALMESGRLEEAIACFRKALALNPRHANAYCNLGNALSETGSFAEAAASYRQALALEPQHANARFNLANTLKAQMKLPEAVDCYRQALALGANQVKIYNNLGNALKELGKMSEALENYEQALRLDPRHVSAHINRGEVLRDQGQLEEAVKACESALAIDPDNVAAHNALGAVYFYQGLFDKSAEQYEQTLQRDPGHATAHFNRSILRLIRCDFERGWTDYEFRWKMPSLPPRVFKQARWDGAALGGKTILLYAEQGLGDTIQFARYASLVKAKEATVLLECQPALVSLLQRTPGVDKAVPQGGHLPAFDVHFPLLSLPGFFGTNLETIPADVPYVRAGADKVTFWKKELESCSGFKIGIVWQGNPLFQGDHFRSPPLKHFEALAKIDGVNLIGLQIGPGHRQLESAPFRVLDLGGRFDPASFEDIAAAMMNLDLVVTSDTAVPHLAGALGVPVWTALPFVPDWRWLLEREDNPWYPTMRLFRQKKIGAWSEVFERIAAELKMQIAGRTA